MQGFVTAHAEMDITVLVQFAGSTRVAMEEAQVLSLNWLGENVSVGMAGTWKMVYVISHVEMAIMVLDRYVMQIQVIPMAVVLAKLQNYCVMAVKRWMLVFVTAPADLAIRVRVLCAGEPHQLGIVLVEWV
jgi:hypothetical protein